MSHVWRSHLSWSKPASSEIDLWRIQLAERRGDRELLSDDEKARADRLLVAAKAVQFIAARAALRRILGLYRRCEPAQLRFEYAVHGKPLLTDAPDLAFNISHSGSLALVAVTGSGRLGVDVELCDEDRPLERMALRFFAAAEADEYVSLPPEERVDAFYRVWTRKEAYVKALGTGLTFSSRRFRVVVAAELPPRLLETEMAGDDPDRWQWQDVKPAARYLAALCWDGPARRVRRFESV